jgi:protein SCO1/2
VSALLLAVLLAGPAETAGIEDARPKILRDIGFDQRLGETLPADLRFKDDAGRDVRLADYLGRKPLVMSLNYYGCPMLCTVTLNGLAGAMKAIGLDAGRDYDVLTVSFDAKETPALAAEKKKQYVERYGRATGASGWHFLTGEQSQIDALTNAVGFRYAWDEETKQWAHPAGIVVLTPRGKIARYLYGIEYAPKDLRLALVEAGEGKVGNAVDQAVLFCYEYDPTTGRYGAAIMRGVRTGGVLTVVALLAYVFTMLRRERRAAAAAAHAAAGGR